MASYFQLLRLLCIATTVTAATFYATNCGLSLAAAADPRVSSPTGIHRISLVTLWPLQLLVDPATGAASTSFGPSGSAANSDKRGALLAMSILDLAAVLSLFIGLAVFHQRYVRSTREADLATISIDDFSLQFYGFPRVPLQPDEIKAYLHDAAPELEGTVAEVTVARAYGQYLERVYAAEEAEAQLDDLLAESAATGKPVRAAKQEALSRQAAILREELAKMDENELVAVAAYVTFDTVAARDVAAAAFPGGALRAALPMLSTRKRFRGTHVLRASHAGDPNNLFWENIHHNAWERAQRTVLSILCTITLLLVTTSLVVGAKQFDNKMPPYVECSTGTRANGPLPCDALFRLDNTTDDRDPARAQVLAILGFADVASCNPYISSADQFIPDLAPFAPLRVGSMQSAPDPLALQCGAAACYGCYCSTKLNSVRDWYSNKYGLYNFCHFYWSTIVNAWVLKGISMVSVIGVNIAFLIIMPKFTNIEKLPTRAERDTSNVRKIFAASFFNAYIVTLAVYANIANIARDFPLVFRGPYSDFTPQWYQSIGSALFVTVCTQLVQPPAQSFLMAYFHHMRFKRVAKQRSQRALNALMVGPTWQLSYRTAKVLSTAWLALALSGGIPGVGLILPFGLWLAYFADKWFLCNTSCTPPRFRDAMTHSMRSSLVWAIWLHLILTSWMFGCPALPAYTTGRANAPNKQNGRNAFGPQIRTTRSQFNLAERLQRWQSLVQFIAFFALSLWLFVVRPNIERLRSLLLLVWKDAKRIERLDSATFTTFTAAKSNGHLTGVPSYHILQNETYAASIGPLFSKPICTTTRPAEESPLDAL